MSDKDNKALFEDELEEFFASRAEFKPVQPADKAKDKCSDERGNNPLDMTGCCFSGCPGCPWNYSLNDPEY